jgi:hypothetical protein
MITYIVFNTLFQIKNRFVSPSTYNGGDGRAEGDHEGIRCSPAPRCFSMEM